MALIQPTAECNDSNCLAVVQVCWADSQKHLTGCQQISADILFADKPMMSMEDTMLITGAFWAAIATAGAVRLMGRSLIKL